jgi:hypothetical protein
MQVIDVKENNMVHTRLFTLLTIAQLPEYAQCLTVQKSGSLHNVRQLLNTTTSISSNNYSFNKICNRLSWKVRFWVSLIWSSQTNTGYFMFMVLMVWCVIGLWI